MLNQRRVLVVQDQFLQRAVQVVRFGETEARWSFVDDAVLDLAIHTAKNKNDIMTTFIFFYNNKYSELCKYALLGKLWQASRRYSNSHTA